MDYFDMNNLIKIVRWKIEKIIWNMYDIQRLTFENTKTSLTNKKIQTTH